METTVRTQVPRSKETPVADGSAAAPLEPDLLRKMDAYWRAANYLSVGRIYLYDNPLLHQPLKLDHVKPRLLGHWRTTPGQNFLYVHLNRVIKEYDLNMIYISGPGHGGPALVGDVYLEGTYSEIYPDVSEDVAGMQKLFKQFSFPGGIPSHVAPETPGSIHEGGELGYSLSHAFGAAFDNPDLDETASNRLTAVFDATDKQWIGNVIPTDDHLSPDGRVVEMLSELQCEGWLERYLLTGRHGIFNTYEAFVHVIDSMFNQHAKWLKVTRSLPWRRPVASLNILLASHVWRQDHNGFTHQDPGFIDHVVNKKSEVIRVYLPRDTNCLLSVMDHCLRSRHYVNVVVASKHPSPQWLTMDQAVKHCTRLTYRRTNHKNLHVRGYKEEGTIQRVPVT